MDVELNAYEVLEIAEKIERSGATFYRRAAGLCDDPKLSKLFVELAQWEARHIDIFRQMKQECAEQNWELGYYAPDRLDPPDPRALAALAPFAIQRDPADQLTGDEAKADILRIALQKEKDSITYYTGLKDFIPGEVDRDVVAGIIEEEMKHVRILTQSLEQVV